MLRFGKKCIIPLKTPKIQYFCSFWPNLVGWTRFFVCLFVFVCCWFFGGLGGWGVGGGIAVPGNNCFPTPHCQPFISSPPPPHPTHTHNNVGHCRYIHAFTCKCSEIFLFCVFQVRCWHDSWWSSTDHRSAGAKDTSTFTWLQQTQLTEYFIVVIAIY